MPIKVEDDVFLVDLAPGEAVGGAKPEPEERHTLRAMTTSTPVSAGTLEVSGDLKSQIQAEMTIDEAARIVGATCNRCKHFDNQKWVNDYETIHQRSSDPTTVEDLRTLRLRFLVSKDPEIRRRHGVGANGEISAEHGIKQMGLCGVFGKLCHPLSSCEPFFNGIKVPPAWEGRTKEIAKETEKLREELLRTAQFARNQ